MQLLSLSQQWGLPFQNPVLIFSLILFIILFAPIILNRFKIPHLIGLIIAGALIGPNGFYLMARDSSIELFGQVGLLYIMFLAGLEIDLGEFKKNKWRSLLFGMYTFTIPMALGIGAGLYLLRFPLNTSILLASSIDVFKGNLSKYKPAPMPNAIGIVNVYIPNNKLLHLFFLNSPRSISKPARNIIYSKPTWPNNSILLSRAIR